MREGSAIGSAVFSNGILRSGNPRVVTQTGVDIHVVASSSDWLLTFFMMKGTGIKEKHHHGESGDYSCPSCHANLRAPVKDSTQLHLQKYIVALLVLATRSIMKHFLCEDVAPHNYNWKLLLLYLPVGIGELQDGNTADTLGRYLSKMC